MIGIWLAIVGSRELADHPLAIAVIEDVLDRYQPSIVISGGAIGIDSMAARQARRRRIPVIEHLPTAFTWPAYRARNLLIAQDCEALVRIVSKRSHTYGSGWTRDRARELGKPTEEIVLP